MQISHLYFFALALIVHSVLSIDSGEVCKKELNYEGDLLKMNFSDPAFTRDDKCFLACILEKHDVFKVDGTIDRDNEKKLVEEIVKDEDMKKKLWKAIDECETSAKSDKCETAYQFAKCKKTKAGLL